MNIMIYNYKMTVTEFENRAKYQNGYDREFGDWKIIDIHQIPTELIENSEIDFYCSNGKIIYLLRIRYRGTEYFEVNNTGSLSYLIAELPVQKIDDEVLKAILDKFNLG
ncbi:hypothetical protein [Aquimarina sp. SS2-1]|uniref:hypothetical protein n=1 Tax=Aquimarina besae TaxID=3342247 RepID=UPI0036709FD7